MSDAGDSASSSAAEANAPESRSAWRGIVQVAGFLLGLGALGACAYFAFSSPTYVAQMQRLIHAPWWQLGLLLLLSAGTIAAAGLVFESVLRPVRRLRMLDCIAVNSVCSALSYLPFKMSLVFRVLYHRRADGIPLLEIGAWLAATAGIILVSLAGPLAAGAFRQRLDAVWWVIAIGGLVMGGIVTVVAARWLAGPAGLSRISRLTAMARIGVLNRFVAGERFAQLHRGTAMLADPTSVARTLLIRAVDVGIHSARFYVAAMAVGLDLPLDQAVLAGATFFFLQAAAPTGVAGVREAGTAGVLGLAHQGDLLVIVLAVAAAEATMNLLMGLCGAVYLRLDRLIAGAPARAE